MSCAAFTFLGIFVAYTNRPNLWIAEASFVLAFLMMIVAFYQAWRDERLARQLLETQNGPNILLRMTVNEEARDHQILELINDGTETATDVTFEEDPKEPLRIVPLPWRLPYVRVGEPQRITANFFESPISRPGARLLEDFLRGEQRGMILHLLFKNASGRASYKRTFIIECPILTREIHCFPSVREVLSPISSRLKP